MEGYSGAERKVDVVPSLLELQLSFQNSPSRLAALDGIRSRIRPARNDGLDPEIVVPHIGCVVDVESAILRNVADSEISVRGSWHAGEPAVITVNVTTEKSTTDLVHVAPLSETVQDILVP